MNLAGCVRSRWREWCKWSKGRQGKCVFSKPSFFTLSCVCVKKLILILFFFPVQGSAGERGQPGRQGAKVMTDRWNECK